MTRNSPLAASAIGLAIVVVLWAAAPIGCGPSGHFARPLTGVGGDPGTGGASVDGSGGQLGSGGSGGNVVIGGAGGAGTGGAGTGGRGTGGAATGGTGTGGIVAGTGGRGTGGAGVGGVTGTGGGASGGIGAGGTGTGTGTGGAGTGGAGGISGARILSVDFVGGIASAGGAGGTAVVPSTAMGPTEIAGVVPAASWNSAPMNMGALTNLLLGDGTATTATLSWNSPVMGLNPGQWRNGFPDTPGNSRMMNGYLDPTNAATPATITIAGLPATIAAGYDVYVYATGDVPAATVRTYVYAIGAATFTVSQTGASPTTFTGFTLAPPGGAGNYVVFRGVTGTSFTLTATPGAGATPRAPVNGIQIVSTTGS